MASSASAQASPEARRATQETIVGGALYGGYGPAKGYLIAAAIDDVVCQFGPFIYELMRLDPAISGSLNLLFAGILAEGPKVVSALTTDPGEAVKSRRRKRELKVADEVAEYWQDQLDGLRPGIDQVLWEMLDDATLEGCTLAEPVYRLAEDGEWKGKLVLESFQVKPHGNWQFIVDPYLKVRKIHAFTENGWREFDRSKYVLMSWQPRKGDPRGTRLLRPAYPAFNVKLQAIPDYAEYLKHFADPKLVLKAGPNAEAANELDQVNGTRTQTTPQQRLLAAAQLFSNRSALALAHGDEAQMLYSKGNGEAYLKGFEWTDREMFRTIIIGARGMQEAQHGSKADTNSAMDIVGMAVTQSRKPVNSAMRYDLFYQGTVYNWGKEVADRFTPSLSFGVSDHLSPELMRAMADAWRYGVFQVPQRPWMLSKLGAPLDPQEDPDAPPKPDPNANPDQASGDASDKGADRPPAGDGTDDAAAA